MQVSQSQVLTKASSHYHYSQKERISIQNSITSQSHIQQSFTTQELTQRDKELMSLDPKQRQMLLALEALLGKKISIISFKEAQPSSSPTIRANSPTLIYEQMQEEASSLDISFLGKLKTEDGKLLDFSLSIQWDEAFAIHSRQTLQGSGEFNDPLVITLDGDQPITKEKFNFNLTQNAHKLNYLSDQAGYLAIDRDGNNLIDTGSELFGPQSGDGFEELRAYDDDKNGWIDANDTIYANLKFWKVSQDTNELLSLEEVGIGAISLQEAKIDFTSKADINTPIAHYKEASVAVGENGKAYGVFSVDLAT